MAAGCRCCRGMVQHPPANCRAASVCCPPHCALPASLLPEGCEKVAGLGTYRKTLEGGRRRGRGRSFARQSRARLLTSWWRMHEGIEAARTRDGVQQEQPRHAPAALGLKHRGLSQPLADTSHPSSHPYNSPTAGAGASPPATRGAGAGRCRQGHGHRRVSTSVQRGLRAAAAAPGHQHAAPRLCWQEMHKGGGSRRLLGGPGEDAGCALARPACRQGGQLGRC